MPYKSIKELPENLQRILPKHAQEIYISAYNDAFQEYKNPLDRKNIKETREEVSHKVAWGAIKTKYHKEGDYWVEN